MKISLPTLLLIFFTVSCTNIKENTQQEINHLKATIDSLEKLQSDTKRHHKDQIATFLTFQKEDAEQAMNFYINLFDNSEIIEVKRWEKEAPGKEGTIMHATFTLNGKLFMCSDSPPIHQWGFTPAVSNYIQCKDKDQLELLFSKLSENGTVMMPLNNYGFSERFGFVEDKFGVSWQLNLN